MASVAATDAMATESASGTALVNLLTKNLPRRNLLRLQPVRPKEMDVETIAIAVAASAKEIDGGKSVRKSLCADYR